MPVAAAAVALAVAVGIVLSQGGPHTEGLQESAASASAAGKGTQTPVSPGATNPASSPGTANPSPGAGPTKAGPGAAPAAPRNLTATPTGSGTIRLQWSDAAVDEEGFTVTDGVTSRNVGIDTAALDWTGLPPATRSCFKVRAYNSIGVSDYHPAGSGDWICATTLPGSGPSAPTNLRATAANPNTVALQWTDTSANEEGFTITNGSMSYNVGANVNGYDWNGFNPGTYTCFKVRAYNSSGVSAYYPPAQGDWVCITTPET